MTHGAPDWWSRAHIDIIAQALAYLEQRPMYGEAKNAFSFTQVSANNDTTLINVLGKGMVYGGIIFIATNHSISDDEIHIYVDGDIIFDFNWGRQIRYNFTRPYDCIAWVCKYDNVNHEYAMAIKHGITFEESIKIVYSEKMTNG